MSRKLRRLLASITWPTSCDAYTADEVQEK